MKTIQEKIERAGKALVITGFALCVALVLTAAGYYSGSNPNLATGTSINATNTTSVATNGLYTAAIGAAAANFNAVETNLVPLNPGLDGNYGVICLQGQSMLASSALIGTVTSIVVVVTSAPKDIPVTVTNGTATGWGGASQARAPFGTFTWAIGTNAPVMTNIILSPNSTPAFNRNLRLFVENITCNVSNNFFTNWSISMRQDQ